MALTTFWKEHLFKKQTNKLRCIFRFKCSHLISLNNNMSFILYTKLKYPPLQPLNRRVLISSCKCHHNIQNYRLHQVSCHEYILFADSCISMVRPHPLSKTHKGETIKTWGTHSSPDQRQRYEEMFSLRGFVAFILWTFLLIVDSSE